MYDDDIVNGHFEDSVPAENLDDTSVVVKETDEEVPPLLTAVVSIKAVDVSYGFVDEDGSLTHMSSSSE